LPSRGEHLGLLALHRSVCGLVHLLLGEAGDVELAGDGFGDEGIPMIRFAWLRI